MNPFYLFILLFTITTTSAQTDKASITGTIKDYSGNGKVGEVIIFENIETKEKTETISNDAGVFAIDLACGHSYQIIIKGFNEDQEYTQFEIPELQPNQSEISFEIEIQYEAPKMFTLDNVHFESGKASLTKDSQSELKELLEYLQLKKTTKIEIAGHTDNVGQPEDNLVLSKKRAEAVKSYLVKNGIDPSRIIAKGYGETKPVASNDTPEGQAKNRRTEVHILEE